MEVTKGQGEVSVYLEFANGLCECYSPKEIADAMGYSHEYVCRMCDEGKLIARKIRGQWWIPLDEIEE